MRSPGPAHGSATQREPRKAWHAEPSVSSAHPGQAGLWQGRGHQAPGKWAEPQTARLPRGLPGGGGRGSLRSCQRGNGQVESPLLPPLTARAVPNTPHSAMLPSLSSRQPQSTQPTLSKALRAQPGRGLVRGRVMCSARPKPTAATATLLNQHPGAGSGEALVPREGQG